MLLPGGWPRFYFGAIGLIVRLVAGLMVSLVISGVVSIASEIVVGLSG